LSLIHNEKTKLLAGALNTAATSSFTVGVLAPFAAAFYNFGGAVVPLRVLVLGAVFWFAATVALHMGARRLLERLRE
jgi:hypothetical protein